MVLLFFFAKRKKEAKKETNVWGKGEMFYIAYGQPTAEEEDVMCGVEVCGGVDSYVYEKVQ